MNDKMIIKADGAELYLERTFATPRERVWAAFTECQHLKHWWGPQGWDLTIARWTSAKAAAGSIA